MRRPVILAASALLAASLLVTSGGSTQPAAAAPAPRPAASTPSGFTDTKIGDVASPTTVAALPEGRAAVLTKAGTVRIVTNGVLAAAPALDLGAVVCTESERGLLGFAADPAVQTNGYVYLYYTFRGASGCVNRVSRFTLTGPTIDRASELVLVDNISSRNENHNGGDLEIGNDGYLYIAVGDAGCNPRNCSGTNTAAQDLSLLNGKILRVSPVDGSPAPDNPYVATAGSTTCRTRGNTAATPTTPCQEIFASGLRNPYRFAFDPNTGSTRFYINDVGQNTREEVNIGAKGANYGWPAREGICPQGQNPTCSSAPAGVTDPIADYGNDVGTFITAGAAIPNGVWPAQYDDGYLFADGGSGSIFLRPASAGTSYSPAFQTFANGADGITDMAFVVEPSGYALYYVQIGGQLRKITYDAPEQPTTGALIYSTRAGGPLRVLDSRNGAAPGLLHAGTGRAIDSGAPSASTKAALVNITMITPSAGGYVTAWAARTARPPSSNINGTAGEVTANASIVPVNADGDLVLYTSTSTHLIVDVLGYFDDAAGPVAAGRFTATTPRRFADTRVVAGASNRYSETGAALDTTVNVPIRGEAPVPSTGVASVAVIVTATSEHALGTGYVTATPHGASEGPDSTVNVNGTGDVRPNLAIVPLGANGSIDLHLHNVSDVLVDVVGYFTDASSPSATAGRFHLIDASRELDSRVGIGGGRFVAGQVRSIDPATVPTGASAIAQNIVITGNALSGYVTSYPMDIALPTVSNGNTSNANQTRAALSLTKLSSSGWVSYFSNRDTDLIVDVFGYFEG